MAVTSGIILAVGSTVAAGAGVYTAVKSSNAAADMRRKADEAEYRQTQAIQEAQAQQKAQQDKETSLNLANASRDQAKSRQDKLAQRGQSYRDTILTSPLGVPQDNNTNTAKKTLLGM